MRDSLSTARRDPRRWWCLAALSGGGLVAGLDMTVLNVALPTLARDLDASTSDLQWFLNAYTLALAVGLLPAGALTDRLGAKRVLLGSFVLFAGASLLCGYAHSPALLIGARALLGLGAATMMTAAMATLTLVFDPDERPTAMGIWMALNGLGLPAGPLLGGYLLDHTRWAWVFWVNVPLAVLALVVAALAIPGAPGHRSRPLDVIGALGSAVALGALTYGLVLAGDDGWTRPRPWLWIAAGIVLSAAVLAAESRLRHPLIELALFRRPEFAWAAVVLAAGTVATMGLLFLLPQYLQTVRQMTAFRSGLELLALIAGLVVGSRLGPILAARYGIRPVVAVAFALFAVALWWGSGTAVDSPLWSVRGWQALGGLAFGLCLPTAMSLATTSLADDRAGVGNAMIQAIRQVGSTLGVAILGSVLGAAYRQHLVVPAGLPSQADDAARESVQGAVAVADLAHLPALGDSARSAFTSAMGTTLLVTAALAVVALAYVALVRPDRRRHAARGVVAPAGGGGTLAA